MITIDPSSATPPFEQLTDWGPWGTIPEWLALVGIIIAVYQIVAQRRRITVSLVNNFLGTAEDSKKGQKYWVVDVVNAGGASAMLASLQVVNGDIVQNPEAAPEGPIAAGGRIRIWIDAPDPNKVWFAISG